MSAAADTPAFDGAGDVALADARRFAFDRPVTVGNVYGVRREKARCDANDCNHF